MFWLILLLVVVLLAILFGRGVYTLVKFFIDLQSDKWLVKFFIDLQSDKWE